MADDDGPNNVINFPRVGYTAPADPPAEPPAQVPADVPFAAPADPAPATAEPFALVTRTDPMDVIAALPDPGQGAPFSAAPGAAAAPRAAGAVVPATFRSEGASAASPPGLGSLSLAAILAVSLAAMRGIHSSIASGRASREQREAVAKTASSGKDGASKDGSKKPVPSGPEYGRKALQSGSGGSSGRSGSGGPGRSGRGGSGTHSGSGGRGRGGSTTKSPSGSGSGSGGGRGRGSGSGSGGGGRTNSPTKNGSGSGGGGRTKSPSKNGSGITPLKRSSQGGGGGLKKNRNSGPGGSGSSGKGPNSSGGGGGKNRGPGGGGGSSGGGSLLNRKRGPGNTGAGAGGSSPGPKKHGPGSGKTTGPNPGKSSGGKTTPTTKGPTKGTDPGKGTGGKTTPGASSSKGSGTGKGTGAGPKSGKKKSPRGTTGPAGILRKKPGTTTPGTGPKTKPKGKGGSGSGPTTAPGSKRGGKKSKPRSGKGGTGPASVPKAPGGKSRKGKKQVLTPGIAHGTFASSVKQDCRCRACRRFKKEYSRKVTAAMKSAARGRTTFGEAVHETAEKRLKRRRKKMGPPIVTKVKVRKPKKKSGPKTKTTKPGSTKPAGPAGKAPSGPAAKAPSGPAAKAPARRTSWSTAKARARKRARMRTTTVPTPTTGTTAPPVPPVPPGPPGSPAATPAPAGAAAAPGGAATAPSPPPGTPGPAAVAPAPPAAPAGPSTGPASVGGGTVPGTGQQRLTPFEAMGMATAVPAQAGPVTVERADSPEPSPATSGAGGPADNPSTKENSVSTAPDTRDSWLAQWGSGGIADMDAQHETEVTLDDSLDVLEELTAQSFKAHETCNKLSMKARQIRYELEDLAVDLRSTHNVIGRLTGAAMAKLAESMELLARKADEMAAKSLMAAELSESAENAMFDAYRPLQQATEDTGLAVPAARVHNQN
ncbi:hypothetical protein [Streptomyces sp. NPDC017520]|uniref:hypothetical protein n=1 Tax=Streptomyces sp. NPDC017520 TaxID=3364998 RepID=UPI0037AE866A